MQTNNIDWNLVVQITVPILALILGAYLDRWLESKPKLISYYSHVASFMVRETENAFRVRTHSVVVANVGRQTAKNVRLGHNLLGNFDVNPVREYSVLDLEGGGKELCFGELVPGEQITVSYLYTPPTLFRDVNTHVKSEEGFATIVTYALSRQYGKRMETIAVVLMFVGVVGIIYLLWTTVRYFLS